MAYCLYIRYYYDKAYKTDNKIQIIIKKRIITTTLKMYKSANSKSCIGSNTSKNINYAAFAICNLILVLFYNISQFVSVFYVNWSTIGNNHFQKWKKKIVWVSNIKKKKKKNLRKLHNVKFILFFLVKKP